MLPISKSELHFEFKGSLFDDRVVYAWSYIDDAIRELKHQRGKVSHVYRHAATEYNAQNLISGQHDIDLSWEGIEQAKFLRTSIPSHFDLVVCSQLKRTWQTMHVALAGIHSTRMFYVDRRINEVSLGALEGTKRRHIIAFARGDIDYHPPGGESYRVAAQRAFSFIVDLLRTDHQASLIFTHAGIMRVVSTLVLPVENGIEMFSQSFSNTFCISMRSDQLRLPKFWLA